jgi:hypothetical protein
MKDILPELFEKIVDRREVLTNFKSVGYLSYLNLDNSCIATMTDEDIKKVITDNFGDSFLVDENERIYKFNMSSAHVNNEVDLNVVYNLSFSTTVGIVADSPVVFYLDTLERRKHDIYILNSHAPIKWDALGSMVINPNHIDIDSVKPDKIVTSLYSHTPLFFEKDDQIVARFMYGGRYTKPDEKFRVKFEQTYSYCSSKPPKTDGEDAKNVGIYQMEDTRTLWQRLFNVSEAEKALVWVFTKRTIKSYTAYDTRILTGNAAEHVLQNFKTFKLKGCME